MESILTSVQSLRRPRFFLVPLLHGAIVLGYTAVDGFARVLNVVLEGRHLLLQTGVLPLGLGVEQAGDLRHELLFLKVSLLPLVRHDLIHPVQHRSVPAQLDRHRIVHLLPALPCFSPLAAGMFHQLLERRRDAGLSVVAGLLHPSLRSVHIQN